MKSFGRLFQSMGIVFMMLEFAGIFLLVSLFVFAPQRAQASSVIIDESPIAFAGYYSGVMPTTVFISDTVGYTFYLDSSRRVVYSKTTNGGSTWGAQVIVDSQTDGVGVAVWYDRWTPGDTTGTLIHVVTADQGNDDMWYTALDTADDSQTTTISASINSGQGGNFANGSTGIAITKSTTGSLYIGATSSTDNFVVRCDASCTTTAGWTEAGTNPYTGGTNSDWIILMPLTDGDLLTVFWDASLNDILSKEYEDGANAWDGSFLTINANADENAVYDGSMAATINPNTGEVYLAYLLGSSTINNNDSIQTVLYNGTSWTAKTSPISSSGIAGISGVTISFDQNTEAVYVGYVFWETFNLPESANVYYRISTDDMTTWSNQIGPVNDSSSLFYGMRFNLMSDERLYGVWFDSYNTNLGGGSLANLDSGNGEVLWVDHSGTQSTTFSANASNQYIGAAFTFTKSTGAGNVTSLTLTETSSISAQNDISNIDIYYEQTGSCSYDGGESLFGTTANFTVSDTVTVTGTMPVSTSQTCVYMVFDTASDAVGIFDIEIQDPSQDIALSSGVVVQEARVKFIDSSNVRSSGVSVQDTIDSTVNVDYRRHTGANSTVVFLDDDTGYAFFVNSTGRCEYSKTTNGGGTWAASVIVDSQTDCIGIAVWYDRWTPGDTTGNYIHVATIDSGNDDIWYTRLDTTNDSQTTTISVNVNSAQGGSLVLGSNAVTISKATDGVLYTGIVDNTDSFVVKCSASCNTTAGWTEAGTNPFTNADNDWVLLMPLADGDILAVYWRVSVRALYSKEYDAGTNSWSVSWTTIDSDADANTGYDTAFSTTIDPDTGIIYLAYVANEAVLGDSDGDIRTASYDGTSWTAGTDVVTNSVYPIPQISISYDSVNDDIYVVYSLVNDITNFTSQAIYYAVGSNSLASWTQSTDTLNNSVNREVSAIRNNMVNADRLYATWYDAIDDTLFGLTFFDITTPSGTLSVDIVDGSDVSVASPVFAFSAVNFSFSGQNVPGEFGTSSQKIRVQNTTSTATWTLSLAGNAPTDLFVGVNPANTYDFNDTAGAGDGADPDSADGALRVYPSTGTLTPQSGCTSTGIALGSTGDFTEGVTDSITVASASGSADVDCYWDFTDIDLLLGLPENQPADIYSMDFVLSVIAS